jgi:hypothetical protein
MPKITVVTIVTTTFEVPEGVAISQVRHLALPELSEMDELTDAISASHTQALNRVYLGDADPLKLSVEQSVTDGTQPFNPA